MQSVLIRSPQADQLVALIEQAGGTAAGETDGGIGVRGIDAAAIGELAAKAGLVLHELTPRRASLEEAFMELTRDSVDYHASPPGPGYVEGVAP